MPAQVAQVIPLPEQDKDKRHQIITGASEVFLSKGFDAGSMAEIARVAGVSKGTLYVYFKNKEELFDAIVSEACQIKADEAFDFDHDDHDVEAALKRVGIAIATIMCRPDVISSLRTVIAISARMPELGRRFYTTGSGRKRRAAASLSRGAECSRRDRHRRLRSRRRAVHRRGDVDDVQAGLVQF